MVKTPPAMWKTRVRSLGREDLLEKVMATHSSTLQEFHGQRSLAGYSPQGHKEVDTTERLSLSLSIKHQHACFFFFNQKERSSRVGFRQFYNLYCLKCIKTEKGRRTPPSLFVSSPKQCSTKLTVFPRPLGRLGRSGKEEQTQKWILFLLPNVTHQLVMFSSNNLICQALQLISHI